MRKVVIVGCGGITTAWMNSIEKMDDVNVVGACDLDPAQIDGFIKKWELTNAVTGTDLADVISRSAADTVFDCTVPAAHKSVTLTALDAGCDVLGEKPMAESMEDARQMTARAAETGKTYAVIQNRRYNPEILRYKKTISAADIGSFTGLHADFFIGAHFSGFRTKMDHVLLLDMAIHSFDEARFLSGTDPVAVTAFDWNPKGSWYNHGANAVAVFEMTEGVVFTYRGSWCAEGQNTSWECAWRATGEKGSVSWDGFETVTGEIMNDDENFIHENTELSPLPSEALESKSHSGVIREFLDSLENSTKPQTDCTDNIKSIAMVLGAIESAEAGKRIEIHI
ncbi:MAG: Gfo/Idh/MocA family oxidoreductase [Spirochaetales bacterium]|jgi:predicted dehydrogenase|nr:Gfo/Idh/MocA family oxidoreductase [Spirochaetales bacterium]